MNSLKKLLIIPAVIGVISILSVSLVLALDDENGEAGSPAPGGSGQAGESFGEQLRLRADLAHRLGVDVSEVAVASFEEVTWPDGCLGVINPAALCIAELTEGYLAFLTGPDGTTYRYHGGQDTFVALDFEEGIVATQDPVAP